MHWNDGGVLQLRGELGFLHEPTQLVWIRVVPGDLHGQGAVEVSVEHPPHLAHSSPAQHAQIIVPVTSRLGGQPIDTQTGAHLDQRRPTRSFGAQQIGNQIPQIIRHIIVSPGDASIAPESFAGEGLAQQYTESEEIAPHARAPVCPVFRCAVPPCQVPGRGPWHKGHRTWQCIVQEHDSARAIDPHVVRMKSSM
jgi:hypothetical protein